ncbi:LEM domain-containing protein 1 isoform X1 [Notothenia coriiceps]|uniref:LEM domain-containing protein 1 isoform X1 n=1 Tax=Notothenia coriiceps TaxID=8208 RepID=A0A6I9P2R7_9TELE|nr:PREDICTED: lamina-associated polypeptide 2, isoforms beta/gamma-like isoform X1 [Notothenia coriiceps]
MSLFMEDPAHFSKSRLKSDLVAHNVVLPPTKSRKEIYVDLHLKHIAQKNAGDFSSDDEDQEQDLADKEEEEDAEILVQSCLTDDDLKAALLKHGVKAGPIVASTRALYENKLRRLQQSEGQGHVNGVEKGVLYSDSEEEEEQEDGESGSEGANEETAEQSNQAQQGSSQNGDFVYPQCFLLSSRMRAHATRKREPIPKRNSRNVIKSSQQSRHHCSQIPVGITKASSVDQRSGLGSGFPSGTHSAVSNGGSSISSQQSFSITEMVQEVERRKSLSSRPNTERELNGSNVQEHWSRSNRPDTPIVDTMKNQSPYYTPKESPYKLKIKPSQEPVKDTIKEMFLNMEASPTGICATRRRPIKGAAGRPVQYIYPDTPTSPTTLERREVERRLVPIHIQILVFFIVACLLYMIYVCVEENSFNPFVALLDSPDQGSESEEGLMLQAKTQDTPVISGQE